MNEFVRSVERTNKKHGIKIPIRKRVRFRIEVARATRKLKKTAKERLK